ncbi:MAG: glycosyltransferase family 2 protein [Pseudomonadota bacterium]
MANFCAVIMAKEEKAVIDRVVDYYLDLGATRAVVYFDGTPDFSMDDRGGRLDFIIADEAFWVPITGRRSEMYDVRQTSMYKYAIEQAYEEWLFFVDCDEYLVSSRPISEILDHVPETEDILRVHNVEAVWGPGDDRDKYLGATWFRPATKSANKQRALKLIYGDLHKYMHSGLFGHSAGKHFVRTGRTYQNTTAHTSVHGDGRPGRWADKLLDDEIFVCHFDAMSFEHWRKKFIFRYQTKDAFSTIRDTRNQVFDLVARESELGDEKLRELFERLYCLSSLQIFALKPLKLAFQRNIFE